MKEELRQCLEDKIEILLRIIQYINTQLELQRISLIKKDLLEAISISNELTYFINQLDDIQHKAYEDV